MNIQTIIAGDGNTTTMSAADKQALRRLVKRHGIAGISASVQETS